MTETLIYIKNVSCVKKKSIETEPLFTKTEMSNESMGHKL